MITHRTLAAHISISDTEDIFVPNPVVGGVKKMVKGKGKVVKCKRPAAAPKVVGKPSVDKE
eukprot:11594346-Alexandrium_andersonii.AAC.1